MTRDLFLTVAVMVAVLAAGLLAAGWWRCRCLVDCGCIAAALAADAPADEVERDQIAAIRDLAGVVADSDLIEHWAECPLPPDADCVPCKRWFAARYALLNASEGDDLAARPVPAAPAEPEATEGEQWQAGHVEFAWVVDDFAIPWTEGEDPRPVLAKYDPFLVRREVGPWLRSDDPRFAPRPAPVSATPASNGICGQTDNDLGVCRLPYRHGGECHPVSATPTEGQR